MTKPKRDRTTGLPLPNPVVPLTSICFTLQVPNALEYRSALKGVLSELGKNWTWAQTAGEDNQDAYTAAELWRQRLLEATYQLDCGDDMSCEDVASCIDTDPAVQAAIASQLAAGGGGTTVVYNTATQGAPMLPSAYNQPVIYARDCDNNSLFGSVTAIVQQMDRNNRDFLEVIEVGTNTRERASQLIAAIPLFETLPIDEAIDYLDKLQSEILENYEAAWTDALADTYRCDLFCIGLNNPNCEVTFVQVFDYFNGRLGNALDLENLFGSLVQYFTLGTWSGSLVVDIMMLNQVAIWRAASNWSGISLRSFQTVGLLGANDDDPDWEILCDDCDVDGPRVTIVNGLPSIFTAQTQTFVSRDGAWDVWTLNSAGFVGAPFTPGNGIPYSYGTNFKEEDGRCIDVESVSGMVWHRSLNCGDVLVEGEDLDGSYKQIGTYSLSVTTLTIKVKLSEV